MHIVYFNWKILFSTLFMFTYCPGIKKHMCEATIPLLLFHYQQPLLLWYNYGGTGVL